MSIHPEQHPLDGKLEPETKDCFNDRAPLYSIAISLKRIADAPREAAARITELEDENEQLRLAICGGEDAPGYAASLPLATILQVQTNNELEWRARAERAEARCRSLESASPAEPSGWTQAREFVRFVGRLDHTGDDGWVPGGDEDSCVLDNLIARARDILASLPPTSEGGGA